ncbi:MAG: flap endonuclease-1 [Thermoproteota archaeon]|nr:MAG: flap endonuclease-1 [Candidatus Korarchaeota archaeon]
MGVKISDLVIAHRIDLEKLRGKSVAIDAFNAMYQFLSIIRQRDGTPLMTSSGEITSVHSGVFYRTAKLLATGIIPVYVFDGEPPPFKRKTVEEREEVRREAMEKWREALAAGRLEDARKYAQAALSLTSEMIEDAKKILEYMGVPIVQAPSEGEAQAAYMAKKGDVWAAGSQDYDSLLFGSPRLVRNLTFSERRKLPGEQRYVKVYPEEILLKEVLDNLGISREQLIIVGILVGTDYNPGGIKGIGCKRALKLVEEHKTLEKVLSHVKWEFEIEPMEIFEFFLEPPTSDDYDLTLRPVDDEKLYDFMVNQHEFSPKRVEKTLEELRKSRIQSEGLEAWF